MRWWILCIQVAVSLALAAAAGADGKVFPSLDYAATDTPDQRALIHWADGVQTLVIETRFSGEGTDFAWIVPLPAEPEVFEATTGLFPTLRVVFSPRIHAESGTLIGPGAIALSVLLMAYIWFNAPVRTALPLTIIALAITTGFLLPALGKPRSAGAGPAPVVDVLDRRIVGAFETATIASEDPAALLGWLADNGYAAPTSIAPAVREYVDEGWVFVAARLRRDGAAGVSTPHPLGFRFPAERAVYPLRLTGIDNGPCRIELHVFGDRRAAVPGLFETVRCDRTESGEVSWRRDGDRPIPVKHRLLRELVGEAPVGTKLVGTLSPGQMRRDAYIDWRRPRAIGAWLWSPRGARLLAADITAAGLFAALLVAWISAGVGKTAWPTARRWSLALPIAAVLLGSVLSWSLPKADVKYDRRSRGWIGLVNTLAAEASKVVQDIPENTPPEEALALTREEIPRIWAELEQRHRGRVANWATGLKTVEEDSPGNYIFRIADDGIEFVSFGSLGEEFDVWRLWP
jgi:hypothetical protein